MKRNRIWAALAAVMLGILAGCGQTETPEAKPVHVWAGGTAKVQETFEKLVADFNEQADGKYTATLHFVPEDAEESLTDMLVYAYESKQTETEFDVVELGDDALKCMISRTDEESLMQLDLDAMPNAEGVTVQPVAAIGQAQPYCGTAVMLAYNAEAVPESELPTTMEALSTWITAHPGRFAYNAPGTSGAGNSFVRTCIYNQIPDEEALMSDDPKWEEKWDTGFAMLTNLHRFLYRDEKETVTYPADGQAVLDLLAQGKIDMCPSFAGEVIAARHAGVLTENIKLANIEPALIGSVRSAAVPSFSGNKEGGTAFINYLLSKEAQTTLVQQMAAVPLKEADAEGMEEILQFDAAGFRTQALGELVPKLNQRWREEMAHAARTASGAVK